MAIELPVITVDQLYEQLKDLRERGLGSLPVVATDVSAYYPFSAYTVLNESGYTRALLINVRPDAAFAQTLKPSAHVTPERINHWNSEAQAIRERCGAFA